MKAFLHLYIFRSITLLFALLLLLQACFSEKMGSQEEQENAEYSEAKMYRSARFKCWLLSDSIHNRYAPPRVSDYTKQPYKPGESAQKTDINNFITLLNLNELARFCYQDQCGTIILAPHLAILPKRSNIWTGPPRRYFYFSSQILFSENLNPSILMENIWLLYQLSLENYIQYSEGGNSPHWTWTKFAYENKPSTGTSIANLSSEYVEKFPSLKLIQPLQGEKNMPLPPIPIWRKTVREEVVWPVYNMGVNFTDPDKVDFPPGTWLREVPFYESTWQLILKNHDSRKLCSPIIASELKTTKNHRFKAMDADKNYTPESSIIAYYLSFISDIEIKRLIHEKKIKVIYNYEEK